jgi:GH24 family phage-related lysozyme (muramidase)
MKISEKGLALIQRFEGCELTAYRDCRGVWTIGWGTTNADKSITGRTIKRGLKIS